MKFKTALLMALMMIGLSGCASKCEDHGGNHVKCMVDDCQGKGCEPRWMHMSREDCMNRGGEVFY